MKVPIGGENKEARKDAGLGMEQKATEVLKPPCRYWTLIAKPLEWLGECICRKPEKIPD